MGSTVTPWAWYQAGSNGFYCNTSSIVPGINRDFNKIILQYNLLPVLLNDHFVQYYVLHDCLSNLDKYALLYYSVLYHRTWLDKVFDPMTSEPKLRSMTTTPRPRPWTRQHCRNPVAMTRSISRATAVHGGVKSSPTRWACHQIFFYQ